MKSLTSLNLSHNEISEVPHMSLPPKLKSLDLAHNSIAKVGPLESLKKLQILRLDFNPISSLAFISKCYTLEEVYLCGGPEAPSLSGLLAAVSLPKLRILHAKNKNWSAEQKFYIARYFEKAAPHLEVVLSDW